jgi:hypothetical protein
MAIWDFDDAEPRICDLGAQTAVALDAVPTTMFLPVYERNSWSSYPLRRYRTHTMRWSIEAAREEVESLRTRGASWNIWEVPAVAFCAEDRALVIADVDLKVGFASHSYSRDSGRLLLEIEQHFPRVHGSRLIKLWTTDPVPRSNRKMLRRFKSESVGSRRPLKWHREASRKVTAPGRAALIEAWVAAAERPHLGMLPGSCPAGVEVRDFTSASPLEAAGVRIGDVITRVVVRDEARPGSEVVEVLTGLPVGTPFSLDIERVTEEPTSERGSLTIESQVCSLRAAARLHGPTLGSRPSSTENVRSLPTTPRSATRRDLGGGRESDGSNVVQVAFGPLRQVHVGPKWTIRLLRREQHGSLEGAIVGPREDDLYDWKYDGQQRVVCVQPSPLSGRQIDGIRIWFGIPDLTLHDPLWDLIRQG